MCNESKKKIEQKIVCLNQGSGTAYEKLDELLSADRKSVV